jgi:hypothetical protein
MFNKHLFEALNVEAEALRGFTASAGLVKLAAAADGIKPCMQYVDQQLQFLTLQWKPHCNTFLKFVTSN